MMNKENIGLRLEEVTMSMVYEFGGFTKQFDSYKKLYQDMKKIIILKQAKERGDY